MRRQHEAAGGSFIGSTGQGSGAPACSPGLVTSLSPISLSFRFFAEWGPWTWESPQALPTLLCTCCILQECGSQEFLLYFPGAQEACRRMGQLDEETSPYCGQGTWFLATSPIPGLLLSVCWLKMTPNFMASQNEFGIISHAFAGWLGLSGRVCYCCQRRLGCSYLWTWWGGTSKMPCPHGWQGWGYHWSMSVWPPRGFGLSQHGGWAPSGSDRRIRVTVRVPERSCRTSFF